VRALILTFLLIVVGVVLFAVLWLDAGAGPAPGGPPTRPTNPTTAEPGPALQEPFETPLQESSPAGSERTEIPSEFSSPERVPQHESAGDLSLNLRVRDDRGQPVGVVLLNAFHTPPPLEDGSSPGPLRLARSLGDPAGTFKVEGFCPGEWALILNSPAQGWGKGRGRELVRVHLPHSADWFDVTLKRPARVEGLVLDAAGLALAAVEIETTWGEKAKSDERGAFIFPALPGGPQTLLAKRGPAKAQTQVDLRPGDERRDVIIRFDQSGRIDGWVFDAQGQAAPGMDVVLLTGEDKLGSRRSDEFGEFHFDPVLPGEYVIVAAFMDLAEDTDPSFFENLITHSVVVEPGQATEVVLQVVEPRAAVRLHGTVTRAGEPMDHGNLFAVTEGGTALETARTAIIGPDGSYSMSLESHGPVMFFESGRFERAVAIADVPPVADFRQDIDLPTGSLIGTVQGATGLVQIQLHALNGFSIQSGKGGESKRVQTRAQFTGLMPGRYVLSARDDAGRLARSAVIELGVAEERVVELVLASTCRVSGTVVGLENRPLAEADVSVLSPQTGIAYGRTRSDSQGRFLLEGLPPGTATIQASKDQMCAQLSLNLEAGGVNAAQLELQAGGSLVVEVRDSSGNPRGAHVRLLNENQLEVTPVGRTQSALSAQAILSEDVQLSKRFLGPLAPGQYTVQARGLDGSTAQQSVEVNIGEETSLTLTLD